MYSYLTRAYISRKITDFHTETYFDYITIGSTRYSGSGIRSGPWHVLMNAGAHLMWYTNYQ